MPLPPDPASLPLPEFRPAARRTLRVFGAEAELVLLPHRKSRPGAPASDRPALRADPVPRILAAETLWRGDGVAATPNRYPFAAQQTILWSEAPVREHREDLLALAFAHNDAIAGTVLLNTIGAAASIARAHVHCTVERLPFLRGIAARPWRGDALPDVPGVQWRQKDAPFLLLGAAGAAPARAAAIAALQVLRLTPAMNVVDSDGCAWLYPRSPRETPAPHFPQALGAAEVWGRWCYVDEEPYRRASAADLEQALTMAGCAP